MIDGLIWMSHGCDPMSGSAQMEAKGGLEVRVNGRMMQGSQNGGATYIDRGAILHIMDLAQSKDIC